MSALNVFLRRDKAWMHTDASLYDQNGRIVGFGVKAYTIPNHRAVVSARGLQGVAPIVAPMLSWTYPTFDESMSAAAPMIRGAYQDFLRNYVRPEWREKDIELIVLGWSESEDRPKAFRFYSEGLAREAGVEAYKLIPFEEDETWDLAPAFPSLDHWQRLGAKGIELDENGFTVERFDPVEHGLAYLNEQRAIGVDFGDGRKSAIVGGFALMHEVTREGVSERIIHRWSDRVGEPIAPEVPPAFDNVQPLMNRKARRAAAKQRSIYAR